MNKPERLSLSRWSRRKLEAAGSAPAAPPASVAAPPASAPASAPAPTLATSAPELPSIDSLGFDSDFTAFLRPEVDERLKRAALKQLFRDPRFNLMDGLDIYIDDYTKADPIPPDMIKELLQRFAAVSPAAEPAQGDLPPPPAAAPQIAAAPQTQAEPAVEPAPQAPTVPGPAADPTADSTTDSTTDSTE